MMAYRMLCAIWYHPYNFKIAKNIHEGVLLLVKLQAYYFVYIFNINLVKIWSLCYTKCFVLEKYIYPLCHAPSLFENQHQHTLSLIKSSTLPLRKMTVSQGVAPCHTNSTLSCPISL